MFKSRRHKHRGEITASRAHARAGLTALTSVAAVITLVITVAGSLLTPSDASPGKIFRHPIKLVIATKTVTATATATVTALMSGPTATVTVPGPTKTVTVSGPTSTATATATASATAPSPTGSPVGGTQLPYVGAAVQNNGDPSSLEAASGRVLGLHRTYWNYNNIASSITQATADAKAGRIPWLSYKLPGTWADAASGQSDAATKALAAKLATVPGPVWVALHHEPEGDGNLADWVALQKRLLPLLAAAPNVRTSIILTAWDTFDSGNAAYSLKSLWPGTMVDIMGFDVYNRYGDADHPDKGWTEMSHFYDEIAPAAKARGVDWAIAETGYTDAAATKDPDWLTRAYDDMANRTDLPGLGLCYFDSTANSIGSWPLTGVKVDKFESILNRSHAPS